MINTCRSPRYSLSSHCRGTGAALIRVVPYAAISFASFEKYQQMLDARENGTGRNVYTRLIAGGMAGGTAVLFTYPADLLRSRAAAHWAPTSRYPSYIGGAMEIYRSDGIRGLYRGLTPALLGALPYSALTFAVFETTKAYLKDKLDDPELSPLVLLPLGYMSGGCAMSVLYPVHLVKRRMQVMNFPYTSMWQGLHQVYQNEGIRRGLFKGLGLTWLRGPPAVALGFTVNDLMKRKFVDWEFAEEPVVFDLDTDSHSTSTPPANHGLSPLASLVVWRCRWSRC